MLGFFFFFFFFFFVLLSVAQYDYTKRYWLKSQTRKVITSIHWYFRKMEHKD